MSQRLQVLETELPQSGLPGQQFAQRTPHRTPGSERTLAGWNPAPSVHCSCPDVVEAVPQRARTITCHCPDEETKIFQLPQTPIKKPETDHQPEADALSKESRESLKGGKKLEETESKEAHKKEAEARRTKQQPQKSKDEEQAQRRKSQPQEGKESPPKREPSSEERQQKQEARQSRGKTPPPTKPASSHNQKTAKEEKQTPVARKDESSSQEASNHGETESQDKRSASLASQKREEEEKPRRKPRKDRATDPSSEAECHKWNSNEACYSRCGYLPRSAYLINDFHQLMRRVARPRPSSERLQRKAKKAGNGKPVPEKTPPKEPPPEIQKPGIKAKPKPRKPPASAINLTSQPKLQTKEEVPPGRKPPPTKSLKVARAATLISQKKPRPQSPTQDSIKTKLKSATGYADALPLHVQPGGDNVNISEPDGEEEEVCLCENPNQDSQRSQAVPRRSPEAPRRQDWTASGDECSCSGQVSRNRDYDMEEAAKPSKASSRTRENSIRTSIKGPEEPNTIGWQDLPTRSRNREGSEASEAAQKGILGRCDRSSTTPAPTDIFCSCTASLNTNYADTYPEDDESKASRKKPHGEKKSIEIATPSEFKSNLRTGRRYYTETQGETGKDLGNRSSCRSLHSNRSIRVLSSNTESMTYPFAPAPSVASVERASDRDQVPMKSQQRETDREREKEREQEREQEREKMPEQERNVYQERPHQSIDQELHEAQEAQEGRPGQCLCGCCFSRSRAPPDQYPPSYMPLPGDYPPQSNVHPPPPRPNKSSMFGEYMRWERQPLNMSRPLLSKHRPSPRAFHEEQRLRRMEAASCHCSYMVEDPRQQDIRQHHLPPPPPPQHHYPQQRQWSPDPGTNRQASGHLHVPQAWGNNPTQFQQFRPPNSYPVGENVSQYFCRNRLHPYQANVAEKPGKDRTGAMTAAAKGLRGLVKALGGTSRRSRNTSEDKEPREPQQHGFPGSFRAGPPMRSYQPVNYSQEVIDLASHPTEYDRHPSVRRMSQDIPNRRTIPVELPDRSYRADGPFMRTPPSVFLGRHPPPHATSNGRSHGPSHGRSHGPADDPRSQNPGESLPAGWAEQGPRLELSGPASGYPLQRPEGRWHREEETHDLRHGLQRPVDQSAGDVTAPQGGRREALRRWSESPPTPPYRRRPRPWPCSWTGYGPSTWHRRSSPGADPPRRRITGRKNRKRRRTAPWDPD